MPHLAPPGRALLIVSKNLDRYARYIYIVCAICIYGGYGVIVTMKVFALERMEQLLNVPSINITGQIHSSLEHQLDDHHHDPCTILAEGADVASHNITDQPHGHYHDH